MALLTDTYSRGASKFDQENVDPHSKLESRGAISKDIDNKPMGGVTRIIRVLGQDHAPGAIEDVLVELSQAVKGE